MSNGESFGSDTLSDWCMQRDFGHLDWFHASNPDQSFPLCSFQTASCLQLLRHTPGWDEKLAERVGQKNQMASLIDKVETLVHL